MEDWAEGPLWNLGEKLQLLPLCPAPANKPLPPWHLQLLVLLTRGSPPAPLHPVPSAAGGLPGKSDVDQLQPSSIPLPWGSGYLGQEGRVCPLQVLQAVTSARRQQIKKSQICVPPQAFSCLLSTTPDRLEKAGLGSGKGGASMSALSATTRALALLHPGPNARMLEQWLEQVLAGFSHLEDIGRAFWKAEGKQGQGPAWSNTRSSVQVRSVCTCLP